MGSEELEARIKVLEDRVKALEQQVRVLRDIEEIKRLQRAYGYYLERWMSEDLIDLFSDSPEATLKIAAGEFRGKESIARFFRGGGTKEDVYKQRTANPYFFHQVMQLSPIIDVDPDGKRAWGRWYGFGFNALADPTGRISPNVMNGVYEVEYVKEDGKWKLLKVHWCMKFNAPVDKWTDPSKYLLPKHHPLPFKPDGEGETRGIYPSAFILPFHYKNPVTGK
ncbi:MAG: nuclear transport factor 2 family protein [Candidatus Bathyarchaeia archaeon]